MSRLFPTLGIGTGGTAYLTHAGIGAVTNVIAGALISGETSATEIAINAVEGAALGALGGGVQSLVKAAVTQIGKTFVKQIGWRLALQGLAALGGTFIEAVAATTATAAKMKFAPGGPGRFPTNEEMKDLLLANLVINLSFKTLVHTADGPLRETAADEIAALRHRFKQIGGDPEAWRRRLSTTARVRP